jgi:hypothetical protein
MTDDGVSPTMTVPGVPGAEIREVPWLAETLDGAVRAGGYSVARRGALLQTVPQVGRFLTTDGELIEFVRETGADPLAVEQFLSGSARAALIHQRGGLPLHAACLVHPEEEFAVAIAGHSGAGKSTLAAELVGRGWLLLGDDVTPLYGGPGPVMAWPSKGVLKLWRDACEHLSIDADSLTALPGERDKYLFPVAGRIEPFRLGHIFLLQRGIEASVVSVEGPARLAALRTYTYKPNYLAGLECVESHFKISCQISTEVEMAFLNWNGPASEGADLLASHCRRNKLNSVKTSDGEFMPRNS